MCHFGYVFGVGGMLCAARDVCGFYPDSFAHVFFFPGEFALFLRGHKGGGSVTFQSMNGGSSASLFLYRTLASGNPDWGKSITASGSAAWDGIRQLDDGNTIINSRVYSQIPQTLSSAHFIVDSGGNILWQGDYTNQDEDTGIQVMNSGLAGTVIWAGCRLPSNGRGITIQYFDYLNQAEIWRKNIDVSSSSSLQLFLCGLKVINNALYIAGIYSDVQSGVLNQGIWFLTLNLANGNILQAISYAIANPVNGMPVKLVLGTGQFNSAAGSNLSLTVDLLNENTNSKEIAFFSLDQNLRISHPTICLTNNFIGLDSSFSLMNSTGAEYYSVILQSGAGYFAAVDSMNTVSRQFEVIQTANASGNTLHYNLADNGYLVTVNPVQQGAAISLETTGILPGVVMDNACVKIADTSFIGQSVLNITPSLIQWSVETALPKVTIASPPQPLPQNFSVNGFVLCKEEKQCQSLTISGKSELCIGESSVLYTAARNKDCSRQIQWLANDSLLSIVSTPSDTSIMITPKRAASVYLYARVQGCSVSDSMLLEIMGPAMVSLAGDTLLCPGGEDTLKVTGTFYNFNWQDGSTDSLFLATSPGTYSVSGTGYCNDKFTDTLVVKSITTAILQQHTLDACTNAKTVLTADSGFYNYSWEPANQIEGQSTGQSIRIQPEKDIIYTVRATSVTGCVITDSIAISTKTCTVWLEMPNAFTPNGDGKNDVVFPLVSGTLIHYKFSIFNRSGQLIFTSMIPGNGWDGRLDGEKQPSGAFIWMCEYQFDGGQKQLAKGAVLLIR